MKKVRQEMRDYGYRVIGVICVCLFYTVIFCPVMLSLCQRFVFCICVYAVSVLLVYHLPSHFVPFCVVLLLTIEVPQVCRHYMSFLFVCVDCWLFFLFMVCDWFELEKMLNMLKHVSVPSLEEQIIWLCFLSAPLPQQGKEMLLFMWHISYTRQRCNT